MDEKNRVCSFDVLIPLCEAADFFCVGVVPDGPVAALNTLVIFGDVTGVGIDGMAEIGTGRAIRFFFGKGRLRGTCVVEKQRARTGGDMFQSFCVGSCAVLMGCYDAPVGVGD